MNKKFKAALIALFTIAIIGVVALPTASAYQPDSATTSAKAAPVVPGPDTVVSSTIKNGGVFGWDMADNTIPWLKLGSQLRGEIRAAQTKSDAAAVAAANANNKADDALERPDGGKSFLDKTFDTAQIANIGGKFLERNTAIGSIQLPAGTWRIALDVKFTRTADAGATDPAVRPSAVARVGQTDTEFGTDLGTIMGNDIAPYKGADLTGTDDTKVTLTEASTVTFAAFGYDDKRGSAGSGEIAAAVRVWVYAA